MTLPERISLAHLPTPVKHLERLSATLNKDLYIKRDDHTGIEVSGNKVRKLEFAVKEALGQKADVLITCGGLQSNHARATAAVARQLGIGCHLVLRGAPEGPDHGNLLLDQLLGVDITYMEPEDFNAHHMAKMQELKELYATQDKIAYLLPIGASNAIGSFGYVAAYEEIMLQEIAMDVTFDTIVCAVGSGGTYAGLVFGNLLHGRRHKIVGIPICDDSAYFTPIIETIIEGCTAMIQTDQRFSSDDINLIDGYAGRGYALNTPVELSFIQSIARGEGILLDPVYTGKAFRGLVEEIRKGTFDDSKCILFIHTGGLYGLFPKSAEFNL
jgi:D-cysteine desulfhydrase